MSYIKPNGSENTYVVDVVPTSTQNGYVAINFIGEEIPNEYIEGFKYYDDNDKYIANYSSYKYYYAPNVYSTVQDEMVVPKPSNTTPIGTYRDTTYSTLARSISDLKEQVSEMETYTEVKPVYVHDTEVVFELEKMGAINAQLKVNDMVVPCQFTVDGNYVIVTFEELEEVGEVTLFVIQ